jgi:hypothetical protein
MRNLCPEHRVDLPSESDSSHIHEEVFPYLANVLLLQILACPNVEFRAVNQQSRAAIWNRRQTKGTGEVPERENAQGGD